MIPKRRKPAKAGIHEPPQIRNASHLKWVRGHECAVAMRSPDLIEGKQCSGRIEAAHIRVGTDGGMGVKPGDNWAIPLCSFHHAEQHRMGELTFSVIYGIPLHTIAQLLWARSPHRFKSEK